jgi:protein SCO1/2
MHGLVWEWTLDFSPELDRTFACGGTAAGARTFDDYAAFMRYAYRSSLEARYTVANLGFRGVVSPSLYDSHVRLVESDGSARRLQDLRGRPLVAAMIYTSCTTVCPSITEQLKALERQLPSEARDRVTFALFSLDPGRDTPAALRQFAQEHQLDARWRLFAGSEDGVRRLAGLLGVTYERQASGAIAHSATVVVIDSAGRVRYRQAGQANGPGELLRAIAAAR